MEEFVDVLFLVYNMAIYSWIGDKTMEVLRKSAKIIRR